MNELENILGIQFPKRVKISHATNNSKKVKKNSIFFGLQGAKDHGSKYIKEALYNGASIVVHDDKAYKSDLENIFYIDDLEEIDFYKFLNCLYYPNYMHPEVLLEEDSIYFFGITGTNGKSTCAQLIYNILKDHKKDVRLVGNIDNPVLSERNISFKTIFVIEASSYQIEYSKFFKAKYAAILNITPDHLERHGNFNNYAQAKFKLIKNQEKRTFSFLDLNSPYINKFIKKNRFNSKIIKIKKNSIKTKLNYIKNKLFLTQGNIQNLSFVFAIIKKLNLNAKKTLNTINNFKGLKFRQEIIFKAKNLTIINDSKATSFSSSENILKSLKNVYWILGGIPKKGDKFQMTRKECNSFKAYIFGNNKSFFIKNLRNKLAIQNFKNLKSALKKVINDIRLSKSTINHKTILFSPSAASFDSFRNFEDRGENFNRLVQKHNLRKI